MSMHHSKAHIKAGCNAGGGNVCRGHALNVADIGLNGTDLLYSRLLHSFATIMPQLAINQEYRLLVMRDASYHLLPFAGWLEQHLMPLLSDRFFQRPQ